MWERKGRKPSCRISKVSPLFYSIVLVFPGREDSFGFCHSEARLYCWPLHCNGMVVQYVHFGCTNYSSVYVLENFVFCHLHRWKLLKSIIFLLFTFLPPLSPLFVSGMNCRWQRPSQPWTCLHGCVSSSFHRRKKTFNYKLHSKVETWRFVCLFARRWDSQCN